ncbi:MAG: hypothetical protein H0V34_06265 [Gammaproteobacteria bacterium]|nr:hypothetical protein [Gammaproteobacteria bacterium]
MTNGHTLRNVAIASLAASVFLYVPQSARAFDFEAGKTVVTIGGFAKLSAIYNDASDGRQTG